MHFRIPDIDRELFDPTWQAVRRHLADLGMPTAERRIAALRFSDGEKGVEAAVGGHYPGTRDHVLIILEGAEPGIHYVCTPTHGVVSGKPYVISQTDAQTTEFDAA